MFCKLTVIEQHHFTLLEVLWFDVSIIPCLLRILLLADEILQQTDLLQAATTLLGVILALLHHQFFSLL